MLFTEKMAEIFNLSALCRCCHTDGSFRSLNLFYSYNGQVEEYANMLRETFGLILNQPSIEASYSICDTCIEKLRNALQFKKQVQECEIKFADYCNNEMALQTEIKIESELMEQDINNASICPDTLQEKESLKKNENSSQRGRPKKRKPGRPKTSEKSRAEQRRDANRRYKEAHPEVVRNARKRYAEKHPEVHRAAVKRYAEKHPEVKRAAVKRYRDKKKEAHKAAIKPSDKMIKSEVNIKIKEFNDDTPDYEHSNAEYAGNIELSDNDSNKEKKENIEYEQNCLEKQKPATPCTDIVTECLKKEKTVETHSKIQAKECLEKQKSNVSKAKHKQKNRVEEKKFNIPECNDDTHDYEHFNVEYADNIELSDNDSDKDKKENIEYEQNCFEKQKFATLCTEIFTECLKKEKTVETHSEIQPKECLEKQKSSKAKHEQINRLEDAKFNIPECNDDTHDYEHFIAEYADNIELSDNDSDKEKKENIEYEQNCLEKQKSATPCTEIVTECLKKEKTVETHSKIQAKECLEKQKTNVSKAKHKQKNYVEEEKFNIPDNPKSEPRIKDNSDTGAVNICHNCNTTFKSAITLRNHLQRKHSIFSCKICKEIFGSKEALIKHEPIHSTMKPECDICGNVFTTKSGLTFHKNQHTREKIFTCDICNKDFLYKTSLRKHIDYHLGRNKKIMCDLCGHTFNDMANLKSHIRAVHEKLRPFKCDQCSKTYSTRKMLKIHTRGHTGERPYVCQHCDKAFVHSTALRYHNERLHTDPEFRCNTARRSRFTSRRHIGVKCYKCYYCEREFSGRFALKRHIERHKGTAKIFPCETCHKNFATKAVMIRHMKSIHDPNKQFVVKTKCNFCNKTVRDMVKHMKTHTEKLFQCEQCPKSYSETSALNRHVREIHCGITHDCNLCDKKYIKAKSLRIHKLKKHNAQQLKVKQEDDREIENDRDYI